MPLFACIVDEPMVKFSGTSERPPVDTLFLRVIVLWTKFGIFVFIVYLAKPQDYSSSPHSKTVSTAECLVVMLLLCNT